ncbi:RrF2 family transcriptional regulator [Anaerosphaera multitolerans]|uniref:Rrf2 family transcriptional regulator n=1 Tax=Anaerosphaera multitolerans TaxID=2487351 RepID=A0A437S518_9FIRM|nr:Rrf2 family transcriptional regulator [Anaerosphaera multitolerans]RVU54101.1 Rrf2 family transcriptional regulator [Anaerosphaera multitolerans]
MRITREIDYAFRICAYLASREGEVTGAPKIAKQQAISERFTLRILRKLNLAGITEAKRGATGGYLLKKPKETISLYDIIVAVDGPITVNNCLDEEGPDCTLFGSNPAAYNYCKFHMKLLDINNALIEMFSGATLDEFI